MSLYRPKFIKEWWDIKKEGGLKLLFKKGVAGSNRFLYILSYT